jgi:hypothetical protein
VTFFLARPKRKLRARGGATPLNNKDTKKRLKQPKQLTEKHQKNHIKTRTIAQSIDLPGRSKSLRPPDWIVHKNYPHTTTATPSAAPIAPTEGYPPTRYSPKVAPGNNGEGI